jgi:hypothetical protein
MAVRGEVEAVVEQDHAVAQPAPPLLGMVGDDVRPAASSVLRSGTGR